MQMATQATPAPAANPAPGPAPFIRIEGVSKRFGTFQAVDKVTLNIAKGEIFGLLGGSGCGKTTLLRMLAGFEEPTEGQIWLDGQDMTGVPPYERPVNMMFQSYALFPHMTVERNVAYGLKHEKMTDAARKDRVREMLDLVQLTQFAHRKPHQISGGQRQRVALARALARAPKLLLLDEPLAALDKKLREHTQFELMNIQHKTGVTFVVVTHDQEEAMTLSDRIAVMDKGQVKQVGTPQDVYEYPNNRFVAGFIGSITTFEGTVKSVADGLARVNIPALGGDFTARAVPGLVQGGAVTLALRPEKIQITRERPQGPNALAGVVQDLGYFGKDSLYRVALDTGQLVSVNSVNSRRGHESERVVDWEDKVWLSFDPSCAILLTE
ncbi:MAG: polyamine ABC transporter ATP-binding protein [Cereibacter sphaeroides]|uniref:Spermidine/putrescine import ATP-binding protein PotA n=1 Tax=Cereibacter sphaeroides TaxID=1063 RepID=A0A2W5SN87_CERSP|nr:MAG: polyamine ABC transporter ATP-binding protein [Cereibacter sphaeroides]